MGFISNAGLLCRCPEASRRFGADASWTVGGLTGSWSACLSPSRRPTDMSVGKGRAGFDSGGRGAREYVQGLPNPAPLRYRAGFSLSPLFSSGAGSHQCSRLPDRFARYMIDSRATVTCNVARSGWRGSGFLGVPTKPARPSRKYGYSVLHCTRPIRAQVPYQSMDARSALTHL